MILILQIFVDIISKIHYGLGRLRTKITKVLWSKYLTKESACPFCGKIGTVKSYGNCYHVHCTDCMSFETPMGCGGCPKCYPITK